MFLYPLTKVLKYIPPFIYDTPTQIGWFVPKSLCSIMFVALDFFFNILTKQNIYAFLKVSHTYNEMRDVNIDTFRMEEAQKKRIKKRKRTNFLWIISMFKMHTWYRLYSSTPVHPKPVVMEFFFKIFIFSGIWNEMRITNPNNLYALPHHFSDI